MDDDLVTGEAVALEARPTPFALRVAGGAIDLLVYGGGTGGLAALALGVLGRTGADEATLRSTAIVVLVAGLVGAPVLVETLTRGRSLGRLAAGARIVRDDGGAITARHAFIRALLGVIEIVMTFGGLATVVSLLAARSKRLGDMAAGTYSRHERVPRPRPLVLTLPPALAGWAAVADVARLPDSLSRRIARFLAQAGSMTPPSRTRLAEALLAEAAPFVRPLPPAGIATTDEVLVAVAVLRRDREAAALAREAALLDRLTPVLGNPHGFPDRG